MKCSKCSENAVLENPFLCKKHFIEQFEKRVIKTIKEFSLLNKKDKICVAASGGKDSVALLYLLNKLKYNVEALALDEGIKNYRDKSLKHLKKFCEKHKIPLRIYSYKKEVGKTIDILSKKYMPACTVCGTFRRHLLDKYAKGYDKLATGHNLDDESQAVLMNILKAQTSLMSRQGPKTQEIKGFVQKVKPFYFMKEKEIMTYAFLLGLNDDFEECPYAPASFRAKVRDLLNEYEAEKPGTKLNIVKKYLSTRKEQDVTGLNKCSSCGEPCSGITCKACRLKKEIDA